MFLCFIDYYQKIFDLVKWVKLLLEMLSLVFVRNYLSHLINNLFTQIEKSWYVRWDHLKKIADIAYVFKYTYRRYNETLFFEDFRRVNQIGHVRVSNLQYALVIRIC